MGGEWKRYLENQPGLQYKGAAFTSPIKGNLKFPSANFYLFCIPGSFSLL